MQKGGVKVLIVILVILIIIAGVVLAYKITQDKNTETISGEKENATESFVDIWRLIFRGCWCNQEAESPPPASITYPLSLGGCFHLIKSVPAKIKHPHPKSHALGRKSPSIMEKR